MAEVVVRPAGAGHESLFVSLACCAILAVAGTVVGVRATPSAQASVEAHQLDARDDLTVAEQGLYADLRLVPAELAAWDGPPPVAELAEALVPPFVPDAALSRRGAHDWVLLERDGEQAYVGLSAEPQVAGSMLLHVPHAGEDSAEADIWLHRSSGVAPPLSFHPSALAGDGWQQVVSRFDAGVTRHRH